MDLKLYYAPGACSLVSHVALEEAGATFEAVRVDLAAGQQRSPEYLSINPRGKVPTLVVDGDPIDENLAIVTTVAALFPDAGLLPSGSAVALGHAYRRLSWLVSTAQISTSQVFRPERFTPDSATAARLKADGRTIALGHFATLEAWVQDGWVLGDYSAVDVYMFVFWRWAQRLEADLSAYPAWARHTERLLDRPAVAAVLAREQALAPEPSAAVRA